VNSGVQQLLTASGELHEPKSKGRSRVSNGRGLFLGDIDGRSTLYRRYRDIHNQIIRDLGEAPSEAQSLIARRASTLAVWCEQAESEMAGGGDLDIQSFTTAVNSLKRLLEVLGIKRRPKDISDLASYLAVRRAAVEAQAEEP